MMEQKEEGDNSILKDHSANPQVRNDLTGVKERRIKTIVVPYEESLFVSMEMETGGLCNVANVDAGECLLILREPIQERKNPNQSIQALLKPEYRLQDKNGG